jgi:hypothetical protein
MYKNELPVAVLSKLEMFLFQEYLEKKEEETKRDY